MPYKNKTKHLFPEGVYHAYNRGFEKRPVFHDIEDYDVFKFYLRTYLEKGFNSDNKMYKSKYSYSTGPFKLYSQIKLYAYCLMPNHFHLLLRQRNRDSMVKLLTRICSRYARYYNNKYSREGKLWTDTYKAVHIMNANHYNTVFKYIFDNPNDLGVDASSYEHSSNLSYLGRKNEKFIKKGLPFRSGVIN